MKIILIVPLVFTAIGLLMAAAGVRGMVRSRAFARRAQRVPGTVSDVLTRFSGRGQNMRAAQFPLLAFRTLDGRDITVEAREPSRRGVGSEVGVLYDPADPTDARVEGGTGSWAGAGFTIFGLAFAALAFAALMLFNVVFDGFGSSIGDTSAGGGDSSITCADSGGRPIDCPPGVDVP